jgi:hypothetical protein
MHGMKTILTTFSDEQARKALKTSTLYAWPCVAIGYFVLSWIGVVGVFFGFQAFLLTFHKANEDNRRLLLYRVGNGIAILLGAFETIWFWTHI